ncbi:MAG TPA: membrane protein insertase YidC [Acetobacteraceae bacterium]|jgi:YidC/Oxa1 family membrane protein insertase|nr:membrane protein insertase YidC [Acetobacteraceae bacterium]
MDQKRLILAIAISLAILFGFEALQPRHTAPVQTANTPAATPHPTQPAAGTPAPATITSGPSGTPAGTPDKAVPANVPRVQIAAPRIQGSISLLGARLDDVVLRDYRETVAKNSPLVHILEPRSQAQPYFVQFGWTAADGTKAKLPDGDTLWTGTGEIAPGKTAHLSWDNGEGLTFDLGITVDQNYMFSITQTVRNATDAPVSLLPWSRIRRDYTPEVAGYYLLHEGLLGVVDGTLHELTYKATKSDGEKHHGVALENTGAGGWAGITDKYWLIALIPDQQKQVIASFRHIVENGTDRYQVDYVAKDPTIVAPHGDSTLVSRVFTGAKEVHLLNAYEENGHIPLFSYAVDWGWLFFITKPFFYAIDWLNHFLGNFGLAIMAFTLVVKGLFFPLANKSYRSMSKMKLLGPKMTALREQYKDDKAKLQPAIMALYKAEKVNPAAGCLPIFIQIPVFFALYKVIYVTIEMRHAPFFGWIRDLSAIDPTNVFNLFGLLPFDPTQIAPFLHLGAWPVIMGFTMYFQQKLNPAPPDPIQAKLFQFMPLIFVFMLANFPAGLVIYWSWNNTLTIVQQWYIMRQTKLTKPAAARV